MSELDTNISMIPPFTADDRVNELAEINKELLSALKVAKSWLEEWASAEPYLSQIEDAIAKAEQK